jgi:phosphatidylserine synthase
MYRMDKSTIALLHILFVVPLLLYTGYYGNTDRKYLFKILLFVGISMIAYHSFQSWKKNNSDLPFSVNIYHLIAVVPLLIYIGYTGHQSNVLFTRTIGTMAFVALYYHAPAICNMLK